MTLVVSTFNQPEAQDAPNDVQTVRPEPKGIDRQTNTLYSACLTRGLHEWLFCGLASRHIDHHENPGTSHCHQALRLP